MWKRRSAQPSKGNNGAGKILNKAVDENTPLLIKIVTVLVETDPLTGEVYDIEIDLAGTGHYEALGMLSTAQNILLNTDPIQSTIRE